MALPMHGSRCWRGRATIMVDGGVIVCMMWVLNRGLNMHTDHIHELALIEISRMQREAGLSCWVVVPRKEAGK